MGRTRQLLCSSAAAGCFPPASLLPALTALVSAERSGTDAPTWTEGNASSPRAPEQSRVRRGALLGYPAGEGAVISELPFGRRKAKQLL